MEMKVLGVITEKRQHLHVPNRLLIRITSEHVKREYNRSRLLVHVDNGALLTTYESHIIYPLLFLDTVHNSSPNLILLREIQIELLIVLSQHRLTYD